MAVWRFLARSYRLAGTHCRSASAWSRGSSSSRDVPRGPGPPLVNWRQVRDNSASGVEYYKNMHDSLIKIYSASGLAEEGPMSVTRFMKVNKKPAAEKLAHYVV